MGCSKSEKVYVLRTTYPNGHVSFEGKGLHRISPDDAWDIKEYAYRSLAGALSGKRSAERIREKWGFVGFVVDVVSTTIIYA